MNKKDLLISLIIGEAVAWLIFILVKSILSISVYQKLESLFNFLPLIFPIICALGLYLADLISRKINVIYQVAKFVLVGGLNTLIDWGILALLILFFRSRWGIEPSDVLLMVFSWTIVYYSLYKGISFILAVVNSYLWNKFWTFKRGATTSLSREFIQFFVVSLIGFLINVIIASGIFSWVSPLAGLNGDQWGILAAVVATVISLTWNFIGYKFIVFKR